MIINTCRKSLDGSGLRRISTITAANETATACYGPTTAYCLSPVSYTHLSYKSKKTCYNPEEKWLVFENTHEAIIDNDTWERVQELRKNKRRPTRTGKTNMFSGIARCADCGEKLYYCTSKNFEARQDHFVCYTSRLKGKEVCATHFIRAVVLEQGVPVSYTHLDVYKRQCPCSIKPHGRWK